MNQRNGTALALVFAALLLAGSLAPAPVGEPEATVAALAKERVALIREALKVSDQLQQMGRSTGDESLKWSRRMVDAIRQGELPKADLIQALRDAVKQAEENEKRSRAGVEMGRTTVIEQLEAKDLLLELRIALTQAEAK